MHFDGVRRRGPFAARLFVLAAPILAMLGTPAPALAEEKPNPLAPMLGLFNPKPEADSESIDYRPRAPLVVPPTRDLPEPKEAVRDPTWPKDPDAEKRRRAAIDSRRPAPKSSTATEAVAEQAKAPEPGKRDEHEGECLLNDSGPRSCFQIFGSVFGGGASTDAPKPGDEPARKLLTEPPSGYRAVAAVPEGKTKSETKPGPFDSFLAVFGMKKAEDN
jgi:hypothetical protein